MLLRKRHCKLLGQTLQVSYHRRQQGDTIFLSVRFYLSLRVARHQHSVLSGDGLGVSKGGDPLIHVPFKIFLGAKSINAHGPQKVANALSDRIGGWVQKAYKGGTQGP